MYIKIIEETEESVIIKKIFHTLDPIMKKVAEKAEWLILKKMSVTGKLNKDSFTLQLKRAIFCGIPTRKVFVEMYCDKFYIRKREILVIISEKGFKKLVKEPLIKAAEELGMNLRIIKKYL